MLLNVADIAALVGGTVHGDPQRKITGLNGLGEAGPSELSFMRDGRYRDALRTTRAGAVLLPQPEPDVALSQIVVASPDQAFARLLHHFAVEQRAPIEGIHATAVVEPHAELGERAALGAHVYVADGAQIGAGAVCHPGVYIGRDVHLGEDCVLFPNAVVREGTRIGARCIVHANCTIGSDGFGFTESEGRWLKIPQVGRVIIGDDCEIGSGTCIDRATFGETRIGNGVKVDNLVQIGHNVVIGDHTVIAGKVGIAGSAVIGKHVRIGAYAGVNGHITIGDRVTVGARAGVQRSIPAGATVSGFPILDHDQQRRVMVAQTRLPEYARRLRDLEKRLDALAPPGDSAP